MEISNRRYDPSVSGKDRLYRDLQAIIRILTFIYNYVCEWILTKCKLNIVVSLCE